MRVRICVSSIGQNIASVTRRLAIEKSVVFVSNVIFQANADFDVSLTSMDSQSPSFYIIYINLCILLESLGSIRIKLEFFTS